MLRKLALLVCLALSASAEVAISNATSGPWTAELNGLWRWHAGDDVRWAAPSFDDSNWPTLRVPGPAPQSGPYWIRLPLVLGPTLNPGLLLGPIAYAYDLSGTVSESAFSEILIAEFGRSRDGRGFTCQMIWRSRAHTP